jgi:hypothetical protein
MYNVRRCIAFCLMLGTAAAIVSAESRKAGLWQITTIMTWQKAPSIPGEEGSRLKGGTHTTQVCLTQEMIDKYGALLPQSRGQCAIANKVIMHGSISADYMCSGMMSGKGALKSTWSDTAHETGTLHFVGTFQVGSEAQPIEWTTESTSVFKSADCGSVKPPALPRSAR